MTSIINKYRVYTTKKTMPTVLVTQHANMVRSFKNNFIKESDVYSRHLVNTSMSGASRLGAAVSTTVGGGGGYFTDSETVRTKLGGLKMPDDVASVGPVSRTSWRTDGYNLLMIRDVIEEHARSVAALRKSYRPHLHLEIDERRKRRNKQLEEKGRLIAEQLNLSVHSCCTKVERLYRCLTEE